MPCDDDLEEIVGTLFGAPDCLDSSEQALDALDPERGEALRRALADRDRRVEQLIEALPIRTFYSPPPVSIEQKRDALWLFFHNARIALFFFETALENGCDVVR